MLRSNPRMAVLFMRLLPLPAKYKQQAVGTNAPWANKEQAWHWDAMANSTEQSERGRGRMCRSLAILDGGRVLLWVLWGKS